MIDLRQTETFRNELLQTFENIKRDPYFYFPEWIKTVDVSTLHTSPLVFVGRELLYSHFIEAIPTLKLMHLATVDKKMADFVEMGRKIGLHASLVFDANAFGQTIDGVKIAPPEKLVPMLTRFKGKKVQPLVINFQSSFKESLKLHRMANEHGFRVLDALQALRLPGFASIACGHMNDLGAGLIANFDRFLGVENLLPDDFSKISLYSVYLYRLTLNRQFLFRANQPHASEYYHSRLFSLNDEETVADLGAYDGDSFLNFDLYKMGKYEKFYAFEADPTNFEKLNQLKNTLGLEGRLIVENKAIAGKTGHLEFLTGWDLGSRVKMNDSDSRKSISVPAVSLDDYFLGQDRKVTFVKFDIEGGEMDALNGGKQLLQKVKPKLAISAYHLLNDIPDIFEHVNGLGAGYRFGFAHYSDSYDSSIIYATAGNR